MADARPPRILVVIPSRLQRGRGGTYLVERAIRSIAAQKPAVALEMEIAVGVDPDADVPERLSAPFIHIVKSASASQAGALNSAAARFDHDFIAFLEDDDEWRPPFLEVAIPALAEAPFVSSTQLEVAPNGEVVCINDFPTPSGWIMRRAVWEAIGGFDETYRFHLDNEWLGRLADAKVPRIHLVESTAPILPGLLQALRPRLHRALAFGGGCVTLQRHRYPAPLVRRMVHRGSGMAQIQLDPDKRAVSDAENQRLIDRFGRVPW